MSLVAEHRDEHGLNACLRALGVSKGTAARTPGARSPPFPTGRTPDDRGRPPRWVAGGGVLATLMVLAAGWIFGIGVGGEVGDRAAASPDDASPVLVVLPFENLGPSDDTHFADGITGDLTVRLAAAPGLSVIARSSALQYGGASADIREVGRELGADYALEGTVRWGDLPDADGRIRMTAQLLRASNGTLVWAESYDRELAEIFDVQREIADEATGALDLAVLESGETEFAREPTGDLEAYDHYLQGRSYLAQQFSEEAVRAAIGQYERAVELDPQFAAAWRRLIEARLWLTWVFADEKAGLRAAEDLVHLLEPDPDDPEVSLGRAWEMGADPPDGSRSKLYEGDLAEAVERLQSRPAAHQISRMFRYDALADAYGRMGREERRAVYADSLLELASGLAPEDWGRPRVQAANLGWVLSGLALIHLGEPDRGLGHVRRGLEMEAPFGDMLVGSLVRTTAARAFVRTGEYEEAIGLLEGAWVAAANLSPYARRHFDAFGLPNTLIIDRDGVIRERFLGLVTRDLLLEELEPYL